MRFINEMFISREHIGLILVVIGTIWLAFSVVIRRQYTSDLNKIVDREKRNFLIQPTEVTICRWKFWIGLLFIAGGTLLQW